MVETITPAVCGSRARQIAALAFFAAGALAAAAGLGALLGLAGAAIGRPAGLGLAVSLAVLGAVREAGILRVPVPQSKRQVPERWRFTVPLPVWATGYGAGLGAGVFTYQPVATFWVACSAALALGRPLAAAVAFALYGLGRTLVLLLPARPGADAAAIVERLAGRRRAVLRANAVALALCACLLAASPATRAGVMPLGGGSQLDPSASYRTLAYTQRTATGASSVVVRPEGGGPAFAYPGAETPSLDGGMLAYADAQGIRVVRWRTGEELARIAGRVTKPALEWPWIVFRRKLSDGRLRMTLRNLETKRVRRLTYVPGGNDLGRPSIAGDRIVWHRYSSRRSQIVLYRISTRRKKLVYRSRIALLSNPALSGRFLLWIDQVQGSSSVYRRLVTGGPIRRLGHESGQSLVYWTTDVYGRTAYVTRWNVRTGAAKILRLRR